MLNNEISSNTRRWAELVNGFNKGCSQGIPTWSGILKEEERSLEVVTFFSASLLLAADSSFDTIRLSDLETSLNICVAVQPKFMNC